MGIYNRDYLREDYGRSGGAWAGADVIKWLIIVNVAVFVLQVVWTRPATPEEFGLPSGSPADHLPRFPVIDDWFALDRTAIFGGQVWRLLTYEFLHSRYDVWHLFFNMLFLFWAGRKVEDYYGPREFLLFYLAAGIISGILSVFWYEGMGSPGWSAVGASGAVAAVVIVYALHWPYDVWRIFFIIPVYAMWIAIFAAIYDVYPMLLQLGGDPSYDGVAHSAHVGGMLFALVYQRRNWRLEPLMSRIRFADVKRRLRPKAKLRVYQPESPVDLDTRVDELLAKVAQHGEASLTDAERAELVEASRRYRNRAR
jgi:membrane associated rhomboid family serine protease